MEIIITMRAGIKREVTQRKSDAPQIQISPTCKNNVPKFFLLFFAITFVTCTSTF